MLPVTFKEKDVVVNAVEEVVMVEPRAVHVDPELVE
jgi:hypothetical protein